MSPLLAAPAGASPIERDLWWLSHHLPFKLTTSQNLRWLVVEPHPGLSGAPLRVRGGQLVVSSLREDVEVTIQAEAPWEDGRYNIRAPFWSGHIEALKTFLRRHPGVRFTL